MKTALSAALCAALIGACARKPAAAPAPEKLAILYFDDLSPDGDRAWMRRAIPEQLNVQLRATARTILLLPQEDKAARREQAIAAGATRLLSGYFVAARGELTVRAFLEEASDRSASRQIDVTGPLRQGLIPLVDRVAHQLDAEARPFTTHSEAALERFASGVAATRADRARELLDQSIAADGEFGLAYVAAMQLAAATGQAEWVAGLRRRAGSHTVRDEIDAARLAVESASFSQDKAGIADAWGRLSSLLRDPMFQLRAAEARMQTGEFTAAAALYRRVRDAAPDSVEVLNQLAYAEAYSGDLEGARKTVAAYRALRPEDPNAFDTLGDALYYHNRYVEAAGAFQQAFRMNRDFANSVPEYKAAYALLWAGDREQADQVFQSYLATREQKKDPQARFKAAEWRYYSGRRAEGLAAIERIADEPNIPRGLQAVAHAQATFWSLQAGDASRARRHAATSRAIGSNSPIAALAVFVTQPAGSAAEWVARVDRLFAGRPAANTLRPTFLAVPLLLGGHFAQAEGPLVEWQKQTNGQVGDPVAVFRAWALIENGRVEEAAPLLQYTPLIPATGMPALATLGFPRIFQLRARVAERAGRKQEADLNARLWELYRRL